MYGVTETRMGDDEIWKGLVEWLSKAGGYVHPDLALVETKGTLCRGIFAKKDIPKGELLIRLPPTCIISAKKKSQEATRKEQPKPTPSCQIPPPSPWLRCLGQYYKAFSESSSGDRSSTYFEPYLRSLPTVYETLWDWTDQQVNDYLAGTTLGETIKFDRNDNSLSKRYQDRVRAFLSSQNLLPSEWSQSATCHADELEFFKKACCCMSTRSFNMETPIESPDSKSTAVTSDEPCNGPFLLPVVDLLNHDTENKCTTLQWSSQEGIFFMIAERSIAADCEILHSYGDSLTSGQLLQTFGFVPDKHIEDAIEIPGPIVFLPCCTYPSLSKTKDILPACEKVAKSIYVEELRALMLSKKMDDESWDVSSLSARDLSNIPEQIMIISEHGRLTVPEELITLVVCQLLPEEAYDAVKSDKDLLMDISILDDYFLGNLFCRVVLEIVKRKSERYNSEDLKFDSQKNDNLLSAVTSTLKSVHQSQESSLDSLRQKWGTVIKAQELQVLEVLRKQVLDLVACLENGLSIDNSSFGHHDDASRSATKRQRTL